MYRFLTGPTEEVEQEMNELAAEGWRYIDMVACGFEDVMVLVELKPPHLRPRTATTTQVERPAMGIGAGHA